MTLNPFVLVCIAGGSGSYGGVENCGLGDGGLATIDVREK
jgi:hypothetical protein